VALEKIKVDYDTSRVGLQVLSTDLDILEAEMTGTQYESIRMANNDLLVLCIQKILYLCVEGLCHNCILEGRIDHCYIYICNPQTSTHDDV
jgi:hypothetical protein